MAIFSKLVASAWIDKLEIVVYGLKESDADLETKSWEDSGDMDAAMWI